MANKTYILDVQVLQDCIKDTNHFLKVVNNEKISYLVVDNDGYYSRNQWSPWFYERGINIPEDRFYTSTMASIDTVVHEYPQKKKAAYIGSNSLKEALIRGGFTIDQELVDWVFVGFDKEAGFPDYQHLLKCVNAGAKIICTDSRASVTTSKETYIGPKAVATMLETAGNTKALSYCCPSVVFFQCVKNYLEINSEDMILVSNQLSTMILAAKQASVETIFLPSNNEEITNSDIQPDYVANGLLGVTASIDRD